MRVFVLLLLAAAVMLAALARRIGAPYPALRWGRGRRPRLRFGSRAFAG